MINPFYHNHLNLKEGEVVKAELHKHPLTLVKPAVKVLIFAGLPVIILLAFLSDNPFVMLAFFVVLLAALSYGFFEWYNWYNDVYIITSEKIIDVEQKSLLHRTVSETTWDKVQDTTYSIVGLLPTLFDYGTINIQTAGAKDVISLDQVAKPKELQQKIMEIQKEYDVANKKELTAEDLVELIKESQEKVVVQTQNETPHVN